MGTIKIGKKAPELCLPDENGKLVCLNDFPGRWIILYFYPKDNTSGCTLEAIDFSKSIKKFESMKSIVIGVSPDSPRSHCSFREKHDLQIVLLSDEKHEVLENYNAWVLKKMYGREYYGVQRSTFIIDPLGNLLFSWPKVNVKDHVQEVMQKLRDLQESVSS